MQLPPSIRFQNNITLQPGRSTVKFSGNEPKPEPSPEPPVAPVVAKTAGEDIPVVQAQLPSLRRTEKAPVEGKPKKPKKFDVMQFAKPTPSKTLMWMLGPVNRVMNLGGIPFLRNIPLLNSIPGVTGITNIRHISLPKADLNRLKVAVNPQTAAFIGPNHPEFYTDWMLDKHISTLVAPTMASWATHTVVNGMGKIGQKFWLLNNLIAQIPGTGGKDGKEYSVEWSKKGNAVLLHPEGTVHWTSDRVHKIFPGIVDMAVEAYKQLSAEGSDRPVYIVPTIWKLQFTTNVSKALQKEMRQIEKKLNLPLNDKLSLSDRFYALEVNLLEKQAKAFGYEEPAAVGKLPFFERQDRFRDYLIAKLETRYGKQDAGEVSENIRLLGKAVRKLKETDRETFKADSKIHEEIDRLGRFEQVDYNTPTLTQEHIAENLKRIKHDLFKTGTLDAINRVIPQPVGPRIAHIRVGEPINISEVMKELASKGRGEITEAERDELVETFRSRMQGKIDEVNQQIAPQLLKLSHPNPFYSEAAAKTEAAKPSISIETKPVH